MNGISRLLIAVLLCFVASLGFSQKKDTSKTAEVDLYKSACKLMDSAKYKDAIVLFKSCKNQAGLC